MIEQVGDGGLLTRRRQRQLVVGDGDGDRRENVGGWLQVEYQWVSSDIVIAVMKIRDGAPIGPVTTAIRP